MRRGTNIQHGQKRPYPWPRDSTIGLGLLIGSALGAATVVIARLLAP